MVKLLCRMAISIHGMANPMSKPPFDPSQPFDAGAKPAFDPNQPFSVGDQATSAPSNAGIESLAQPIRDAGNYIANSPVGQAVGKVASVVGKAADIASPLTAIVTPGSGIPELAQQYAKPIAQSEGQIVSDIGSKTGYPTAGAVAGTGISMIPELASAYVGWKGLHNIENPIVKGSLNTPQELSPEYASQNQAVGISDKLPIQRGTIAKYPGLNGLPSNVPPSQSATVAPLSYPKDTNTYLNYARDRVDSLGNQLTPQELSDHKTILSNILNDLKVKGQVGTPVFAKASQLQTDTSALQNSVIPGRADLNKAYGISKTLNPDVMNAIKNYAQKYGKLALKEAIGVGLGVGVARKLSQ